MGLCCPRPLRSSPRTPHPAPHAPHPINGSTGNAITRLPEGKKMLHSEQNGAPAGERGGWFGQTNVDKQSFLYNEIFKCYVNIEGELFTFYQRGKFPLTRSHFLPHTVIFFHGNFLFSKHCFHPVPGTEDKSLGSRDSRLPWPLHTNQEHGVSGGVQAPTPTSTPTHSPPLLCAHHPGMSRAGQNQARSYLGVSHQVSSPTGLNTKPNSVWKQKAASGLHRQTPNRKGTQ